MDDTRDKAGRIATAALLAAGAAWCAWLSGGYFLSDDFVQLANFARWSGEGRLLEEVLRRFAGGIDRADAMWRPLTYATYAASYLASGADARGWLAVNLALHLANAVLAGALVVRLAPGARLGGLFAGVLFFALASGWEAALWIASRYDALATFFVLLSGWWFAGGRPRLAFAACVLALMSKESGAVALVLVGCIAAARELEQRPMHPASAARRLATGLWPFVLLGLAYGGLRIALFGNFTTAYPGQSVDLASAGHWSNLWQSAAAWRSAVFPAAPGVRAFVAAAAIALLALGFASVRGSRPAAAPLLAIVAALAVTLLLLLTQLPGFDPSGVGGRLFYLPGALLAIALGLSLHHALGPRRPAPARFAAALLAAVSLLAHLYWMVRSGIEYHGVHRDMRAAAAGIEAIAATVSGPAALVLVPDTLGRAPFGRNAQAGLMLPPVQRAPLTARVLVQLDQEIPDVPGKVARGLFDWLTRHSLFDYPGDGAHLPGARDVEPSAYFCWNGMEHRFSRMRLEPGERATLADRIAKAHALAGCLRKP